MKSTTRCAGCRDDFYNHRTNADGKSRCWSADKATIETRYRLHWWTAPTVKGAFVRVKVPSCYHQPGQFAYYKQLPDFVKASDLNRARRMA